MRIRPERSEDHDVIADLTRRAFAPMSFSDGDEHLIPARLRAAQALQLSLVAEEEEVVIGQVTFSPATVAGVEGWVALGPIAIEPTRQRQGIGSALTAEGAARLKQDGAMGLVLIGKPAVYAPMGFVSPGDLTWRDLDPALVQALPFHGPPPSGEVAFHPAFDAA